MVAFYGFVLASQIHYFQPDGYPAIYLTAPPPSAPIRPQPWGFLWKEWANVITAGILFLTYILSLVTLPFQVQKFLRAFLVAVPLVLSLYVNIEFVTHILSFSSVGFPLQCVTTNTVCYLSWSTRIMAIITGAFVVIEIVLTLIWGPLRRKEEDSVNTAESNPVREEPQIVASHTVLSQTGNDDSGTGIGSSSSRDSQPQMTQLV
ncbi:hypothetical protein EC991_010206 [Linnemannia zychae]|nr:hypothetical protein EC991_010206 [Linnemannia zychae]